MDRCIRNKRPCLVKINNKDTVQNACLQIRNLGVPVIGLKSLLKLRLNQSSALYLTTVDPCKRQFLIQNIDYLIYSFVAKTWGGFQWIIIFSAAVKLCTKPASQVVCNLSEQEALESLVRSVGKCCEMMLTTFIQSGLVLVIWILGRPRHMDQIVWFQVWLVVL